MVCVPCIFIPVLLFLWHKFVQPLFLRFIWNPWATKDNDGNIKAPEFPFECKGGVCPFPTKKPVENSEPVGNITEEKRNDTPSESARLKSE